MNSPSLLALSSGDISLNFVRGVLAAVNPCGFALLPAYLMFFLGMQGARPGSQRAGIARALVVSASLSGGFFAVFLVIGILSQAGFRWFEEQASWLSLGIGVLLFAFGVAMLFGFRLKLNTPKLDVGGRDTGALQMFLYGMSYAIASIGCTIGLFIPAIATVSNDGIASGVLVTVTYALGMALTVTALTVSLALARTALLNWLRRAMQHLDTVAAVLLVFTGIYLVIYGVSGLRNDSNGTVNTVEGWQSQVQNWLYARSPLQLAIVLGGIAVAAIGYVRLRPERPQAVSGTADAETGPGEHTSAMTAKADANTQPAATTPAPVASAAATPVGD